MEEKIILLAGDLVAHLLPRVVRSPSVGRVMRPISIDSSGEEREFLGLVGRENQKYFWTGGKLSGRTRRGDTIQWPSGKVYNNVNWSNSGGAGGPQPDNREGNEFCLAVLNNFYDNEGIAFHDIACYHRKPVICEAS